MVGAPLLASSRPKSRLRERTRIMSRRDVLVLAVFLLSALLYLWTITSSGAPRQFGADPTNYYPELTSGFLHGHLSLPMQPPKALLKSPNPYSPAVNGPYRSKIEDLALYHGHFYLDWGPTPVLTIYLPWRLIGLGTIPESWAVWVYSVLGLAFSLLLFRTFVQLYVPRARPSRVALGAIALSLSSVVAFIDRTPDIYEVAVASGYCFLMLGLYLLATGGLGGRRSPWRLALGSLSLGLAAGGRWDLLLAALLLGPLLLYLLRRDGLGRWRERSGLAIIVLGPCALFIGLLLAYNYARFGNPLQVGTAYQLAGFDPTQTPYYRLGYLWPSLYYYFVAPVRWTLDFPYFALPPPPSYPGSILPTYIPEIIGGMFTTTPLLLGLFAAPFVARRRVAREWRWVMALLVIDALAIVGLIALGVPGGSMRYEVDFATLLLIPALLTWLLWEPSWRPARRLVGGLGSLLVIYGAVVGLAISITGYRAQIYRTAPGQVAAMENVTQPFANLVTRMLGHPVLASIDANHIVTAPTYGSLGVGKVVYAIFGRQPMKLQALSPDRGTWTLSISVSLVGDASLPPHSSAYIEVSDGLGTHRYTYSGTPGSIAIPLDLVEGKNEVTITGIATAPSLQNEKGIFQASDVALGGPELHQGNRP